MNGWIQIGIVAALLVLSACGEKKVDAVDVPESQPAVTKPVAAESVALPREPQIVVSDVPLLAHGTHMVFGIRMPQGMMPMSSNEKMQRFEGTHSIESVKKYLLDQLAGEVNIKETRFGKGYIINSAIPKSSQVDLTKLDISRNKYNIKIYEGSLGGAGVTIWEAKPGEQLVEQENTTHVTAHRSVGTGNKGHVTSVKVKYKTRREAERATFQTFEKLAAGKPLTEEDYQSPYFTDL